MTRLHKVDLPCRTKAKDPLVFDTKQAAKIVATIPGYIVCPKCWD